MDNSTVQVQPLDPFPLLTLPDLVLQYVIQHLTPKERKATRGTCRKLCKVASDSGALIGLQAAVNYGQHRHRAALCAKALC